MIEKHWKSKIASTKNRQDPNGNLIEMRLTLDQYTKLWEDFGRPPGYPFVISRKNDLGHYEIGNVYIQHTIRNVMETMSDQNEYEQKITEYAIAKGYKRRIVKNLIKMGKLVL